MKKLALGLVVGLTLVGGMPTLAQATDVTVRVEGGTQTLVPRTTVTLPTVAPKPNGADACPAGTAGTALWVATGGAWSGTYYAGFGDYLIDTIKGESYQYPDARSWEIWVNGKVAYGTCSTPVQQGDDVLMFVTRCDVDADYNCTNPPILPLELTAPATAAPGVPLALSVKQIAKDGTKSAASGATVSGGGASTTTGAGGTASITLTQRGSVAITTTQDNRIRDTRSVCVTDGADGYCGTTAAPGVTPPAPEDAGKVEATGVACATSGRDGLCGTKDTTQPWSHLSTPKNGGAFARGKAPRTLSGTIEADGSGIAKVELRLTRRNGRSCQRYSDTAEKFVRAARCGADGGTWFSVGDRQSWSYLLPAVLGQGRYVLDVRVTDKAGNVTKLARGYTRSVFTVA